MRLITIFFLLLLAQTATAETYVQSGRYTELNIAAKSVQLDPLSVIVDFSFPKDIDKVGDALYLITTPSGYRFDLKELDVAYILFEMPLPEVHKHLGPMTLRDAISVLSGKGFAPTVDEATRLISFNSSSQSISNLNVSLFKESWNKKHSVNLSIDYEKTAALPTAVIESGVNGFVGGSEIVAGEVSDDVILVSQISSSGFTEYVVQDGDSVSKIADRFGVVYTLSFAEELINKNPHAFIQDDPNLLMAGEKIQVPFL